MKLTGNHSNANTPGVFATTLTFEREDFGLPPAARLGSAVEFLGRFPFSNSTTVGLAIGAAGY